MPNDKLEPIAVEKLTAGMYWATIGAGNTARTVVVQVRGKAPFLACQELISGAMIPEEHAQCRFLARIEPPRE